jgi:hypothetical protein
MHHIMHIRQVALFEYMCFTPPKTANDHLVGQNNKHVTTVDVTRDIFIYFLLKVEYG